MITLQDVQQARENISDITKVTPLFSSEQLSNLCGMDVFLKSEHLQKTGSFKIRGATNKVKQAVKDGATFVTAASSGNHGQAVAYIAQKLGVPATIVVPEDAMEPKKNAIKAYGGNIEVCGTTSEERLPRAKELAEQNNGVFIPPYDDSLVMAGQGTVGLEILDQLSDVDAVIVPIGGGGLLSGNLVSIKESNPNIQVIGVEPEIANDTYLSLQNGKMTAIPATTTIADGLRTNQPGDMTFPVLQKYLDDLVLVSEDEIKRALAFVLERMKQMIEPSSATTVAAIMHDQLTKLRGKKVICLISGGNVDIQLLQELLSV